MLNSYTFPLLVLLLLSHSYCQAQLVPQKDANNVWGYKKENSKKFKIPTQFKNAYPFQEGVARVETQAGFQLIDEKGTELLSQSYEFLGWSEVNDVEQLTAIINGNIGFREKEKWGVISTMGELVLPAEFQALYPLNDSIIVAKKNELIGLYDNSFQPIAPFQYKKVGIRDGKNVLFPFSAFELLNAQTKESAIFYADSLVAANDSLVWIQRNNTWALAIQQGILKTSFKFSQIFPFENSVCKAKANGKWGVVKSSGQLIVSCQFDSLNVNPLGITRGTRLNSDSVTFFNSNFEEVRNEDLQWVSMQRSSQGLYAAFKEGKYGFVNDELEEVIPFSFEYASPFAYGYSVVKQQGLSGIINQRNQWIIRPVVDSLRVLSPQLFLFENGNIWGVLKPNGVEQFTASRDMNYTILPRGVLLNQNEKLGFLNTKGEEVLPPTYDSIEQYDSLFFKVKEGDFTFFINPLTKEIPKEKDCEMWEEIGTLSEGFMRMVYQNRVGFIDYLCRLRISPRYQAATIFSEGLAAIQYNGLWGYISPQEDLMIQPKYTQASPFKKGLAIVEQDHKFGLINNKGEVVVPCEYDAINETAYGNFLLQQNEVMGIYSAKTKEMLFPRYNEILDTSSSRAAIVQRDGKYGLYRRNGEYLRFAEYNMIKQFIENSFLITLSYEEFEF